MTLRLTIFCTVALSTRCLYGANTQGRELDTAKNAYLMISGAAASWIENMATKAPKDITKEAITALKDTLKSAVDAAIELYRNTPTEDQEALKQYFDKRPKGLRAVDKYTSLLQALYLTQNNMVNAIDNKNKQLRIINDLNKKIDQALKLPKVSVIKRVEERDLPLEATQPIEPINVYEKIEVPERKIQPREEIELEYAT